MVKRRTRALFEFGIAVVTLLVQIRLWRSLLNDEESGVKDEQTSISASGLVLGVLYRSLGLWLRDRDVGGVRTNRRRGLLFSLFTSVARRRFLPRTKVFKSNFGVGQTLGMVVYRLWYGVLRPLPGTNE
jgi:hypothetical protein